MQMNPAKYEQAVLFFLHECDNRHLGKVKLMKLLYYLDFDHFEQHGVSVTGDTYRRLPQGPVGEYAEWTLAQLRRKQAIAAVTQRRGPTRQDRHEPLVPYDVSVFDANEIQTLRAVATGWRDTSRAKISDATHLEAPWTSVGDREIVPYAYAYYRNRFGDNGLERIGERLTPEQVVAAVDREDMIQAVIGSAALEGITYAYDDVARDLDEALRQPISDFA